MLCKVITANSTNSLIVVATVYIIKILYYTSTLYYYLLSPSPQHWASSQHNLLQLQLQLLLPGSTATTTTTLLLALVLVPTYTYVANILPLTKLIQYFANIIIFVIIFVNTSTCSPSVHIMIKTINT